MKTRLVQAGALFLGILLPSLIFAASPSVSSVDPPGAQRGTEADVQFRGDRLDDAKGILFYGPGIDVADFSAKDARKISAKLKIAADCPLGGHPYRLWTATGISDLRMFYVGALPTVAEAEPNNEPSAAQKISLDVTVSGTIQKEDVDCYSIEAKKGQRITAEVEGIRLGDIMFDPWLAIMKPDGKVLAACDDTALLLQDPIVSIIAPEDGTYIFKLRDSSYGGGDQYKYRLHVGTFPQPTAIYPSGGPAGTELEISFLGDISGPITKKITTPALENGVPKSIDLFAEQDNKIAPAPVPFRVCSFPNVLEVEPNDDSAHATKTDLPLPLAFNGVISKSGDVDFFRFKAQKGQVLDFRVYARALRSPLDSILRIYDAQGHQIGYNDDSGSPDSYLRQTMPADGEYCLSVTDQIGRGGVDYTYRVEVTPVQASITLSVTQPVKDTQERQTVVVPRGNRFGAVLRVRRADFGGDLVISSKDLPPGVTMQVAPMPPNSDTVPIVFEAAPDAAVVGKICEFSAVPSDASKKNVESHFEHTVDLVLGEPNNSPYFSAHTGKMAVEVADEAPFKIHIVEPKVPMVQNGSMNLKVAIERKEGFHGEVQVSMLYNPPNIGAQDSVKIPGDQNETSIPLSANGNAPVGKYQVAVTAYTDTGKGQLWVCSPYATLEVAQPFITAKIERGYVEQGQSATVACKLTQSTPFEGKAKIQLLNLPNKVTAQDMEISSSDQEVNFPVAAEQGSTVGQKKDLFCTVTIMKNGEPIVHNIANGGILRVGKAVVKTASK